jgi:hypothetical protein
MKSFITASFLFKETTPPGFVPPGILLCKSAIVSMYQSASHYEIVVFPDALKAIKTSYLSSIPYTLKTIVSVGPVDPDFL